MSDSRETPGSVPGAGAKQAERSGAVSIAQGVPEDNRATYLEGGADSSTTSAQAARWAEVPEELKLLRRWVVWRREQRNGKPTKVPYSVRTGRRASVTNPGTWATYQEAVAAATRFDGIGFVLGDGIAGCDLDGCRDPDTGIIDPAAEEVVRALDSYTEASPSGTGLHVLMFGKLPPGGRRNGKLELYDRGRFFCMTGQHLPGTPATVEHRQDALAGLHGRIFGMARDTRATRRAPAPEQEAAPIDLGTLALTDEENALVERLTAALQSDPKLRATWHRTRTDLRDKSASGPDQALVSRLQLRHGWTAPAELAWAIQYRRQCHGEPPSRASQVKPTVVKALQARPRSELEGTGMGIPRAVVDAGLDPGPLALYLVRAEWAVMHGKLPTHEEAAAALGKDRETVQRYYWRPLRDKGFADYRRPRENFVTLPFGLASESRLSPGAKATAVQLASCVGRDGWANIGLVRLCDRVRRKDGAVKGYLRELQKAGYLVAEVARYVPSMGRRLHCTRYRFATTPTAAPAEVQGGAYSAHSEREGVRILPIPLVHSKSLSDRMTARPRRAPTHATRKPATWGNAWARIGAPRRSPTARPLAPTTGSMRQQV